MEQHRVRRLILSISATALTATALVLGGTAPVSAVEDVEPQRIAGDNRFETAADIAAAAFPDGSGTVLVASGRAFPDALAGAALGLPILLTEPDEVPAATTEAIDALGASDVVILGGLAAVSDDVEDQLSEQADVARIAGENRYETAAMIAESIGSDGVAAVDDLPTAIVATGEAFADALAGGTLATGGEGDDVLPILLVAQDEVPDATSDALDALGIEQTIILGGTSAVSTDVQAELEETTGNEAIRLAGANRYGTAVVAAEFAIDLLAFPGDGAMLANGLEFADALAGGPLGGANRAPMLLTEADALNGDTEEFLTERADTIATITTLGGTAAVSEETESDAEAAAEDVPEAPTNETIEISPKADADQANGSTRTYTVTGLGTTVVDIVLVPCVNVTVDADGNTTFANTNSNTIADGTSEDASGVDGAETPAHISSVNGTSRNPDDPTLASNDYANNVTPVNGSVTFIVTGPGGSTTSSCVTPTVFADDNVDDALNVATATPTLPNESFGTGGSVTFSPAAAGGGQLSAPGVDVATTSESSNRFTACEIGTNSPSEIVDPTACKTYYYDTNDRFQISSVDVTIDTFELALSQDDDLTGTYSDNPATRSTLNILDEAPLAPGTPAVQGSPNSQGATFRFSDSATAATDRYRLYRIVKPAAPADCPVFSATTHTNVAEIADPGPPPEPSATNPQGQHEISDSSAQPSTTYCYRVVPVDDGDEGIESAATTVTTTAGAAGGAPTITSATGSSSDPFLTSGDVHNLAFSEPMTIQANASYTVGGTPGGSDTIDCGTDALCVLSADATTLRVTVTASLSPLAYPLTINAVTGMTDTGGVPVAVSSSADRSIENNTITPSDTARPHLTTAKASAGGVADTTFQQASDVLDVTFNEAVRYTGNPAVVTEVQLEAVLGTAFEFGSGTVSVAQLDADTLRFTIGTALTDGVSVGETVDGTSNGNVADAAGNPQTTNPDTTAPTVTAGP